ncbi:MAG TPA: hypothetical protein VGC12_08265 [Methyloradius sp.]
MFGWMLGALICASDANFGTVLADQLELLTVSRQKPCCQPTECCAIHSSQDAVAQVSGIFFA